jgi:hypothetical protein
MNPWRSLAAHVEEQVEQGRPVLVEVDAYYLPDTAGTAYGLEHVKSTVAVNEIDVEAHRLGYFHGQGYHALEGDDFVALFQIEGLVHERMLPPYIEFVRILDGAAARAGNGTLTEASVACLRRHLTLLPRRNPFDKFKERFQHDLDWLMEEPIETFHRYSFATLRQYGACYELVETYLRWLSGRGEGGLEGSIEAFNRIAGTAKAFQFQLARAMARRRALPLEPLDAMGALWEQGMQPLVERYA